ncbi:hypothetical protein NEOLEDRAFT_1244547 [Neolentinus lepideus HHB14362 ss-1]|uniref:Uncharacterized protein n=1 Tax=Neolentinus lepideus HHB14362 ss-1 TaxID=1314782 RepID=A0A165PT20_9AGAM|nr:hypothetical protein NEOLEDRAFT_1244547 [Neolentinus lepideus HHB14362 ss-1]
MTSGAVTRPSRPPLSTSPNAFGAESPPAITNTVTMHASALEWTHSPLTTVPSTVRSTGCQRPIPRPHRQSPIHSILDNPPHAREQVNAFPTRWHVHSTDALCTVLTSTRAAYCLADTNGLNRNIPPDTSQNTTMTTRHPTLPRRNHCNTRKDNGRHCKTPSPASTLDVSRIPPPTLSTHRTSNLATRNTRDDDFAPRSTVRVRYVDVVNRATRAVSLSSHDPTTVQHLRAALPTSSTSTHNALPFSLTRTPATPGRNAQNATVSRANAGHPTRYPRQHRGLASTLPGVCARVRRHPFATIYDYPDQPASVSIYASTGTLVRTAVDITSRGPAVSTAVGSRRRLSCPLRTTTYVVSFRERAGGYTERLPRLIAIHRERAIVAATSRCQVSIATLGST